ncbi:hypothetical protein ABH922_003156 [Rhodococcus sp. 27YEA15]|uniref:hypothetical protein n=1 Tax=Rhodococcus sp. 27YEA15 TaxID=3156259 RepID=UPI003C7D22BC
MQRTRALALALPLTAYVFLWCVSLSWAESLPDPLATQWGSEGVIGTTSVTAFYSTFLAAAVIPAAIGVLASTTAVLNARRLCTGLAVSLSLTVGGLLTAVTAAQRNLADARFATLNPALALGISALGIGAGMAVGFLADRRPPAQTEDPRTSYERRWQSQEI